MAVPIPLGLCTSALTAKVEAATAAALRGWSEQWCVEASCSSESAPNSDGSQAMGAGHWLLEQGRRPEARLFWPDSLHSELARVLYRASSALAPASIIAHSIRHIADDLLHRLAEAWLVSRWQTLDESRDPPEPAATAPLRWQASVELRLNVAGLEMRARVPGLRFRPIVSSRARPMTAAAHLAAFASASAPLEAVVGQADVSLSDVARLQVGDVLLLDSRLLDPLNLRIAGGDTSLPVVLGVRDGKRAVQFLPRSL